MIYRGTPWLSLTFFLLLTACNSTAPPASTPPETGSPGTVSVNDGDPVGAPVLLPSSDKAGGLVLTAALAGARAAAVIAPTKDLQLMFEAGLPPPTCPSLGADLAGRDLTLTLDYAEGCTSSYFLATTMRGIARGKYYTAYNAFDLALEGVVVQGEPLTGMLTGRVDPLDAAQPTTLNVHVEHRGVKVTGSFQVTWEPDHAMLRLNGPEISVTGKDGRGYLVTLGNVGIRIGSNPSLSPHEGTARLTSQSSNESGISMGFTSQTPATGGVAVTSDSRG